VSRKRLGGQRKALALVLERLSNCARPILDPGAIDGGGSAPRSCLPIEIGKVVVISRGEEGVADVADSALDSPLLVAASDGDGAGLEAVVRRHLEQRGMEPNRIAVTLEHGALEIVVEQNARNAPEVGERFNVSAHEERHRGAWEEAEKQAPGVAEHHHERPERPERAADLQLAEVGPIDLGLLARERAKALERLRGLLRTKPTDDTTEVIGPAEVAALFDHDEESARTKVGVLSELLDDERHERIDHRGPWRDHLCVDAGVPQHALDGGVMQPELARDGADRPALTVIEAHYFRLRFL
jgi:hypothetical protein